MAQIPDEHIGIIEESLHDYRRWFDGDDECYVEQRKMIDAALEALRK